MQYFRLSFSCFILILFDIIPINNLAAAPASDNYILVDKVWAGSGVQFDAIQQGDKVYVAYYNAAKNLAVASYNLNSKKLQKHTLSSLYGGWDAHNYIQLALDANNRLHVAGNMHGTQLVYARMSNANDLSSLQQINRMTGIDEDQVTYPQFLQLQDGSLLFFYRQGGSGRGKQIINQWKDNEWRPFLDTPLFDFKLEEPRSAYPTLPPVYDGDDWYHMAWVWRRSPNVATNCCLFYARSRDLKHWEDSHGNQLSLPITFNGGRALDSTEEYHGLLNNLYLGFTKAKDPVIIYMKDDLARHSQVFAALLKDKKWLIRPITNWQERWAPEGTGTIPAKIIFSPPHIYPASNNCPYKEYFELVTQHFAHGDQRWFFSLPNLSALSASEQEQCILKAPVETLTNLKALKTKLEQKYPRHVTVLTARQQTPSNLKVNLVWATQSKNNDKPQPCKEPFSDCSAPLYLVIN